VATPEPEPEPAALPAEPAAPAPTEPEPEPEPEAEPAKPEAEPAAAPEPPPPVEPAKVTFTVRSEPAGAEVFRDGTRLGTTPYVHDVAPQPGRVEFVLKLDGHMEARAELPGDKGGEATVKLLAEPKPAPPPPPQPVAQPAVAQPTPAKPAPAKPAPAPAKKKTKPVKDGVVNPFAK
jgi:hypothetical protein